MIAIPSGRRSVLALSGLLISVCMARSSGQQAPPSTSGPSTIAVDFLALSADGHPVVDLKAEELSLKIDGRARAVHALQLVQMTSPHAAAAALPTPFTTNAAADAGRALVLVIDEDSLTVAHVRPTQEAAGTLLSGLSPQDRVALVTVPHGGLQVDFTTDHGRVTHALETISAQANTAETLTDAACRTRTTLEALTGMLDSLRGGTAPTTVVFFTTTLTGPRSVISPSSTPNSNPRLPSIPTSMNACDLESDAFQHVGDAAAAARAYFYVARIDDSTYGATPTTTAVTSRGINGNVRGSDSPTAGIQDLTGVTGGVQFPMMGGGGGDSMLVRVGFETSAYYLVTFEPDAIERDGRTHRVELKAARDGVTIRTLPDLVIPAVDAAAAAGTGPTANASAMLRDAKSYRDLTLRSAVVVGRNESDSKMKVIGLVEPTDPLVRLTSAMAGLYDQSGKLVASKVAAAGDLTQRPMALAVLAPAAGMYRLRLAATDSTGSEGATDADVKAQLVTAGPLTVSDIVLGVSRPEGFLPKLEFTDEPVASAYIEFYGAGKEDMNVVVAFELAKTVDGQPMVAVPAFIDGTRNSDRFRATAALPIGSLPPGDYVIRGYVDVSGQPFGRVVRVLRKGTQ